MANIIINKDSHLAKTNRLITLDADDVYAFNRSISGLNQSIYGIQPSKDQILNGIDIEDISSNNSLCSDVYFLDKNFDKLKYFAQKSFIICDSYEDVLSTATNPLAIYLTPISSDGFITDVKNNSGKRIFSKLKLMEELSKIKSVDEKNNLWEDIKQFLIKNNYWTTVELAIYLEEDNVLFKSIIDTLLDENGDFKNKYSLSEEKIKNTLEKCGYDAFSGINDYYEYIFIFKEEVNWDELKTYTEGKIYLSKLIKEGKGKFELIGSTSLTDEKFSKLFSDVYTKCNEIEDNLSETKNDVNKISGDFKNHLNEYNEFSNEINNKVDNKLEISNLTEENLKIKTDENNDNKKIYGRLDVEKNYWSGQQTFLSNLNIGRKINNQNTQIGDITTGTDSLKIFSKNGNSLDIGAINVNNEKKIFDLKIGNNFSFDKTYDNKTNTLLKIEEDKMSSSVPVFSEYLNSKDLYTKRILGTEYIGTESKSDLIKLSPNKISVDNNAEMCVNNLSSTHIFANDITLDGNSVGEMRAIHLKDIVIDGKIVLGNHTNGIVDSAGDLNNNEVNLNFGKPVYFLNLDNSSKTSIYGNLSIKGEMCPLYVDGGKAIFGNYTQSIYHILNTSDSDKEFQIHFENIESTGGVANIRILYSENNLKKVEINENGKSSSYYVDTLKHIIKPNQCFSFKISISYVGGYFLVKYEPILDSDKYVRYDEFSTHTTNTDNPHSVTADQVGADPVGTAVDVVDAHNTSEHAHEDIRAAVAEAQSLAGEAHYLAEGANANAYDAHDRISVVEENVSTHIANTDNPHTVKELQVSTATTERANRSFIRADYNYEGRPWYVDAKVTDRVLFTADATRIDNLFVSKKLQALYISGRGNAGGHIILEGSGTDPYGLTLRTAGYGAKSSIEINPGGSTTIKGDLNIASRAAVTTGDYQKTASAGDLTADGTITAKTGMKVTHTYGEITTDVMSVDSTGLTVQSPKIMLKNELGNPRIWTDSDAIYIETEPPVTIKSDMDDVNITSNSGSVYIDAGGTIIDAGYKAIRLAADNSVGIYARTVDSAGNSLALDFAETTINGNIDIPDSDKKITIASQVDYGGADAVETIGDAELIPIGKFGRQAYLAPVDTISGRPTGFSPGYLYSNNLLTLPQGTVFSDYYLFNPGDTSMTLEFNIGAEFDDNAFSDIAFLRDTSSNVINLNIPSWGIAIVRIYISNTKLDIPVGDALKHAYIVRGEHLGTFSTY